MGFTQVWQPVAYKHGCNTLALSWCGVSEHDHCLAVSLMETVQSDEIMPARAGQTGSARRLGARSRGTVISPVRKLLSWRVHGLLK